MTRFINIQTISHHNTMQGIKKIYKITIKSNKGGT